MGTFMAAYLAVGLAAALYLVRLGARQRRLERKLHTLERRLAERKKGQDRSAHVGHVSNVPASERHAGNRSHRRKAA